MWVRGFWVGCGWCTAVLPRFCAIMPHMEQLMRGMGVYGSFCGGGVTHVLVFVVQNTLSKAVCASLRGFRH